ncbi:MAG: patatin-like phospholipase family protein [Neisseria sp.]|nr:patatin-like phospholipase family protein [Neisseria sp.]
MWKTIVPALLAALLCSCSQLRYRPIGVIEKVDLQQGYRLENAFARQLDNDDTFVVLMFSGGGTRAAALGYGVLEELNKQQVYLNGRRRPLLDSVDIVYGVSGGSVLAAYFSLHGKKAIPNFEKRFLKQNFQRQLSKGFFSLANLPRLTSPEFGRGDLLQEEFENALFKHATFGEMATQRKGPFAVITATDMATGSRLEFTQEYFDAMCLNLSELKVARAVAASSAVPLLFSPLTLNNNGGNCGYTLPDNLHEAVSEGGGKGEGLQQQTKQEIVSQRVNLYQDSKQRPYIHLLDGGLTDNLGLRSLLDMTELYSGNMLYNQIRSDKIRKVVVINVNAQNQPVSEIDKTAAVPGFTSVANAIVNIPIDKYSQESLRRFRAFADQWNEDAKNGKNGHTVDMYFISLNLLDLPESALRGRVLNIATSFYLPADEVNDLKKAARQLLDNSSEYRRLLQDLSPPPEEAD